MQVQIRNLVKHYGPTKAVNNISFSFTSGQIYGFVGPNGAGKSTTMRIMATLDEPTDGDVLIDGVSVVEDPEKVRQLVGYVPDQLPDHRDISVYEYLDFFARAYGLKGKARRRVVEEILDFCNLQGIQEKHINALSKGMKNRVSVARALVHDPAVLIMDEPASGLDPRARIELRELLKVLSSQGKAILISSHILTELSEICDGALFIERGRLLKAGLMDELLREGRKHRTVIVRTLHNAATLSKHLLTLPFVDHARAIDSQTVEVDVLAEHDPDEATALLLEQIIKEGFRVKEYRPREADLEQIFMDVTRGEVQ
ncbi:MAG: ABC transporter ATP-binding protein [Gemmataceae bacterium]